MYNDGTTLQDGTHELHVYKVCSCSSSNRSTLRNGRRHFRFQVFLQRFVFLEGLRCWPLKRWVFLQFRIFHPAWCERVYFRYVSLTFVFIIIFIHPT